jgi:hypothetical protein
LKKPVYRSPVDEVKPMETPAVTITAATAGRLMLLLDDILLGYGCTDTPEKLYEWREELHEALPEPEPW